MFGLRRWKFRRDVETQMSYLIGFNELYLRKLLASFNGIDRMVSTMLSEGKSALEAAVQTWIIIFSYEIERSPQLRADKERIESYIFDNLGDWQFDTEQMLKLFLTKLNQLTRSGLVPAQELDYAVSEILGALDDVDRHDRAKMRLRTLMGPEFAYRLDEGEDGGHEKSTSE